FNAAVAVDVPNLGVVINQPGQQATDATAPAQEQPAPKGDTGAGSVAAESESQSASRNSGEPAEEVNPAVRATQEAGTLNADPEGGASSALLEDGTALSAQGSGFAPAAEVASGPSPIEAGQVRPVLPGPHPTGHSMANALDLETIIALSQWVRSATEKIGAKRLKVLLEICYSARYLSDQSREVILGLIRLSAPHRRSPEGRVPMRACMAVLAQLCNILRQEHNPSPSILSLIFDLAEE
ncbi:MAG: hypothetical protein ACE5KI_07380, partial [Dehalococcoidia bacterium]